MDFIKRQIRKTGQLTDIIPIAVFQSVLIAIFGTIIVMVLNKLLSIPKILDFLTGDEAASDFALQYFTSYGVWILVLLLVFLCKGNRKMWNALKYNGSGNSIKGLLIGTFLGFLTNGICVLFSWLLGDIKLSFNGFDFRCILVFLIAVFIQAGSEELVERFYLYQKLRRRYISPLVAIIVNSLVFTGMHAFNQGFSFFGALQIFTVAIVLSLLVYYYDALWAAMALHMGWNFTQSIIFGLPNSGVVSAYSIFTLEAASARNGFFYNVNFGVEGSIGSSLVLMVLVFIIWYINRGKKEKNDIWAEDELALIQQESQQ